MKATYYEEDWVAIVEIIDDTSTDEIEEFKLKVVTTLESGGIIEPKSDGSIFDVCQKRDENDIYELVKHE